MQGFQIIKELPMRYSFDRWWSGGLGREGRQFESSHRRSHSPLRSSILAAASFLKSDAYCYFINKIKHNDNDNNFNSKKTKSKSIFENAYQNGIAPKGRDRRTQTPVNFQKKLAPV